MQPNRPLGRRAAVTALTRSAVGLGPLALALGMWVAAMRMVDLARMTDMGFISVLPPLAPLAVIIVVASVVWHLRRESPSVAFLAVHLVALIVFLYAIPAVTEAQPRFGATYIHVGISEYISRTGDVAPELEARFDWPGFFILASFLSQVAGFKSTMDLASWAPVYFNLLWLGPLSLIFRSITRDVRLVWAGLFLFELVNWVGQDYYSPQGLNYFLFLSIVGLVVTFFRVSNPKSQRFLVWARGRRHGSSILTGIYGLVSPMQESREELLPAQKAGLVVVMVVVFSFVALAHQLTPFFTVAALLTLVVFNRTTIRTLPVLMGIVAVTWVSYMTIPFLSGHIGQLAAEFGQLSKSVGSNVTSRLGGSPDHQLVVTLGMVLSLSLWLAAALGFLIRFRDGRRDLTIALLIVAPVPLVAAQAYGGELVLRLYLFTLPFAAILAAGMVYGRPHAVPSRLRSAVVVAVCAVITVTFLTVRYGNERMDIMTTAEVQGMEEVYRIAPPGSLLVSIDGNLPWRAQAFEQYTYVAETDALLLATPSDIAALMKTRANVPHSYLILSSSQEAQAEIFSGVTHAGWGAFVGSLIASPQFRLVYENSDMSVFELLPQPAISAGHVTASGRRILPS